MNNLKQKPEFQQRFGTDAQDATSKPAARQ